jgi:hypothetical protein
MQKSHSGPVPASPLHLRRLYALALLSFILAGFTGALMRWWMLNGFPVGVNFINVRHAHSHWMYFGWVTPALMALIAARLPALTGRSFSRGVVWVIASTLFLGVISFGAFFAWGYQPAEVAGKRLPLGIIVSSLHMIPWGLYIFLYWRAARGLTRTRPMRLWDAALFFMALSSAGGLARASLAMLQIQDPFLSAASVHMFLDLFSDGWFVLGLLGLYVSWLPAPGGVRWFDWLVILGLPFSFLLGVPVELVPPDLRLAASLAGGLVAGGMLLQVGGLLRTQPGTLLSAWKLPLLLLGLKALMQLGVLFPALAVWGEQQGLRLLYLHVLLLGFVTLGAAAQEEAVLDEAPFSRCGLLPISGLVGFVLLLLASLLPLTGLWPSSLRGVWTVEFAFWAAFLLPAYAVFYQGVRLLPPVWARLKLAAHW